MKKSLFSETKIVSTLNRNESGEKVKDLCRELGISEATFY
ncbi:MAG: transposase, partial [Bacteroidetes bacterium]|nr:transposase [Bacteroidota bacterium]